jgi:hypothetical protein
MKNILLLISLGIVIHIFSCAQYKDDDSYWTWNIDALDRITEHPVTLLGDPGVIESPVGRAVQFDGIDDGLIIKANPVKGASAFTIEVIFRPDSSYPDNKAQRFVHFQNPNNEDRRILIETRLTPDNQWFLDTFIKSETSSKTLFASEFKHPVGPWYHAALVFENKRMKHFVNGKEELTGTVDFLQIENGYVSLGVRMNQKYWFKGAIYKLKVTHRALSPAEFTYQNTGEEDES